MRNITNKVSFSEHLQKQYPTRKERDEFESRLQIRLIMRFLRESRKKKNLTQYDLAKKAKIPRTTLSKIESGYQNVTMGKLMQIAEALGTRIEIRFVEK